MSTLKQQIEFYTGKKLDTRKIVLVKEVGEDIKIESTEPVKDANKLSSAENYDNIKYSKSHRVEYEKTISKHRPDLVKEHLSFGHKKLKLRLQHEFLLIFTHEIP